MKKFLLILIISNLFIVSASATCAGEICIDVVADPTSHQIVITASKKGSSGGANFEVSPSPKPRRVIVKKPWIPWLPKPVVAKKSPAPRRTYVRKPKPKTLSSADLNDRITKLLPIGSIKRQPSDPVLVQVPVNFWTNTPTTFRTIVMVLEVPVVVELHPLFTWSFGDGDFFITPLTGGPYPLTVIAHTYHRSDNYLVRLLITWSGTWTVGGVVAPIGGGLIKQSISETLEVVPAPTRFTD